MVLVAIWVAARPSEGLDGSLSRNRGVQLSVGLIYPLLRGELHPQSSGRR